MRSGGQIQGLRGQIQGPRGQISGLRRQILGLRGQISGLRGPGGTDGRMDRRTDRQMDGQMNGRKDGWMDGRMNEQKSPVFDVLQDFVSFGATALLRFIPIHNRESRATGIADHILPLGDLSGRLKETKSCGT